MKYQGYRLHFFLLALCLLGYGWLYIQMSSETTGIVYPGCIIKHTTGIPCPSCGATRSVISLLDGEFQQALLINPLGYIVFTLMLLLPVWIVSDVCLGSKSLLKYYALAEEKVRKKVVAVPLILVCMMNWIWNITKGL